jgi:Protein of unknown function (DUF559)
VSISGEPFVGSEAVAGGLLRPHHLRSRFQSVFPNVYVRRDQQLTTRQRAAAAWLWSHRQGVIAGLTAAALHGSKWVDASMPVELVWSNARPPRALRTHNFGLATTEVSLAEGLPATTPARTAFDLGRLKPVGLAIAQLDALTAATGLKVCEVTDLAERHPGARGLRRLETVLDYVDSGAQSPKETWLRLLLIRAGLPRPTTQIPVVSADGSRQYYLDMGWEEVMVAVEYDGEQHRTDRWQYARDIKRSEQLERLGWLVIRVIATDRADEVVRRVRDALAGRRSSLR